MRQTFLLLVAVCSFQSYAMSQELTVTTTQAPVNQTADLYTYSFEIEGLSQATDAEIKTIQTICKPVFENHPKYSNGKFSITVPFRVPTSRFKELLAEADYTVLKITETTNQQLNIQE